MVGAGQGLGNHIAERFAKEDFRVVLMARRAEALKQYQQAFADQGYETTTLPCDVTDAESVKAAFARVHDEVGTPDVLVYNVGITTPDEQPLTEQDIIRHFTADVVGAYSCIKASMSYPRPPTSSACRKTSTSSTSRSATPICKPSKASTPPAANSTGGKAKFVQIKTISERL